MKTWSWRTCVTAVGAALMWSMAPYGAHAAVTSRGIAKANGPASPAVTYSVRAGGAGDLVLSADAGVLQIEKSVFEDGRTTLVLKSEADEVTIAFDREGATTVSGDTRISINAAQPEEAAFGRTRALLAQSKAARLFRDLAATLERQGQPPSAYERMLFVSDAEIARIEGDLTAVDTLGRRLGVDKLKVHPGGSSVKPVSCGTVRRVQYSDCVTGYQLAVMGAWRAWIGCYRSVGSRAWYSQNADLWFCDLELFLRAEGYAFQFVRCVALPI